MRIIDKNTDFYDYLQNIYPDDSLTFDRTDSYILSKEDLCGYLYTSKYTVEGEFEYILLQVCNTFWLFLVTITRISDKRIVQDFTVELLASWKNYSKPRRLMQMEIISFNYGIYDQIFKNYLPWRRCAYGEREKNSVKEKKLILVDAVDTNNHRVESRIVGQRVNIGGDQWVEKHIPLLKACGLGSCIDPMDIYLAFEEYFSLEKAAAERTESVGLTDKERIENHGFDLKKSFRGKNN